MFIRYICCYLGKYHASIYSENEICVLESIKIVFSSRILPGWLIILSSLECWQISRAFSSVLCRANSSSDWASSLAGYNIPRVSELSFFIVYLAWNLKTFSLLQMVTSNSLILDYLNKILKVTKMLNRYVVRLSI